MAFVMLIITIIITDYESKAVDCIVV